VSDRIISAPPAPNGRVKEAEAATAEESAAARPQVRVASAETVVRGAERLARENAAPKIEFLNFATARTVRSLNVEEETR
jgi:hypothetical protein